MTRRTKITVLAALALAMVVGVAVWRRTPEPESEPQLTSVGRKHAVKREASSPRKSATFARAAAKADRRGTTSQAGAPSPANPAGGKIIAWRRSVLPPDGKGGKEGELREWLVEATDNSYTGHIEEHWRPNQVGEPVLALVREYVANQALLTLPEGVSPQALRAALAPKGITVSDSIMELEKGRCIVTVTSKKIAFETVAELLSMVHAVNPRITAEEDAILTASRTPDDPRMGSLWGMSRIQAPEAWDIATAATNVNVAVVDTGVNYFHEDLTDNIVRDTENLAFPWVLGANFVPGIASNDPMDDNGHGTHCAGTVCARGGNAKGVAGVTWNTRLVPVKSMNLEGKGATSWFISAYNWARLNKMDILSCSYGGGGYSAAAYSAIRRLQIMDIMLACAAGNGGADGIGDDNDKMPNYPSSYDLDNILAVASTGPSDELSEFSNFGPESVDIAAPGEEISSTCWSPIRPDFCYETLQGTSMATPHVAGALALVKGYYPDDVYWQTIQRLTLNADYVESLHDYLSTGRRLNVYKAILSLVPPAPIVTATPGVYEDRIEVTWKPVKGATYYKLYRRWSEGGTMDELTGWTTDLAYTDREAEPRVGYHYYVRCSKHADGADASPVSPAGVGYKLSPILDEWDPADDTAAGATPITPTSAEQTHGTHSLTDKDPEDWFRIAVSAGQTYLFESAGAYDIKAELYGAATTNESDLIVSDDDSGTGDNFKVTYTPQSDGMVFLRVRPFTTAQASWYTLKHSIPGFADEWDPADDTMDGATVLEPADEEQTHGLHALSASDAQDLFRLTLEAGRTYVFATRGDLDTFGELYFGSVAAGSIVAWNDDGMDARTGNELNFRLVYTADESGTYYLRVKPAPSGPAGGTAGTYTLVYARAAEDFNLVFSESDLTEYVLGWRANGFFTSSAESTSVRQSFSVGEPIFLKWALNETNFVAVAQDITNLVELLGMDGKRHAWGHAVCENGLGADECYDFTTEFPALPAGAYLVRLTLNSDVDGNASVPELDMSGNVRLCAFNVVHTSASVASLEISGNATIAAKESATYRCTATYGDDSTQDVAPVWSIRGGDGVASVSVDGTVSVGALSTNATVTLRAAFGRQLAEKTISLTPYKEPEPSEFPEPAIYPSVPMTVDAEVYIDGVHAAVGDEVAAYAGGEARGVAKIGIEGRASLSFSVAYPGETISFKVFDASEGDSGAVFSCTETIYGMPGEDYGPLVLSATTDDPFGAPTSSSGGEWQLGRAKARIYAEVKVNGYFAGVGDMVAVFAGDKLVGKGSVSLLSSIIGLFTGASGCTIDVYLDEECDLTFMVWDRTRHRFCASTTRLRLKPGATKGGILNRFLIEASDGTRITLRFEKGGWHLVSVPITPSGATVNDVFSGNDGVGGVRGGDGSDLDGSEEVRVGDGYWVETTRDGVEIEVEGSGDEGREILLNEGWNLVGYTLPRPGRVEDVLRSALRDGKVTEIVNGLATYPGGGLVTMQPGEAYWIRATALCRIAFEKNGMLTATASETGFGPFGDGSDVAREPQLPVRYHGVRVTIGSAPAAYGDCVAVFDAGGVLRAVAKVDAEDGTVSFPVYAAAGSRLHAKIWNSASGLESPAVYSVQGSFDVPAEGTEVTDLSLHVALDDGQGSGAEPGDTSVTNAPARFTVTFDLGSHGTRTGGGELVQEVEFGGSASAPALTCGSGWEFSHWDAPLGNVRSARTIRAVYREASGGGGGVPPLPDGGAAPRREAKLAFDANGGEGEMQEQVFSYDGSGSSLNANSFTRQGYTFVGWSTIPRGRATIGDASGAADVAALVGIPPEGETTTLYAQWALDGLSVGTGTIVANGGARVVVPVIVDTSLPAACLSVRLTYDPNILVFLGVRKGEVAEAFDEDFIVTQPKTGELVVGCYAAKDVVAGVGELARAVFLVRPGTEGRFSDVTVSDVQLADESGVRNVTTDSDVSTHSGMVRVMGTSADVQRLENAETVAADTRLGNLALEDGDAIQASDERTAVFVDGMVTASGAISVSPPVNGWTSGRYALLTTPTAGLSFVLEDAPKAELFSETEGGVTTYYATLSVDGEVRVTCAADELSPGTQNQIRMFAAGMLDGIGEIAVSGPSGLIGVIADMGIAPAFTRTGSTLEAEYSMPEIRITEFDPETGAVRFKVTPGEGNQIVSMISTGYIHVFGTDDLLEKMKYISKVGFDLTPYLRAETKGEGSIFVTLGTHTFLKIKVEDVSRVDGESE